MTKQEFENKIFELFDLVNIITYPNPIINDTYHIYFNRSYFTNDYVGFMVRNRYNITIYESPRYDDYDQFYDEIIIFKELILPNLIKQNA